MFAANSIERFAGRAAMPVADLGEVRMEGVEAEFPAHRLVFAEGDPADLFFQVETGCACSFRCDRGGRRSIDAFHLAGDIFGLDGSARRRRSAEALTPCRVVKCERRRLVGLADREPSAAAALMQWLLVEQNEALLRASRLAHAHGPARLLAFLVDLRDRCGRWSSVELEMSRSDIADYLGFSSETVSRLFTKLRSDGVIAIRGRRVTWPAMGRATALAADFTSIRSGADI